jgi:succinate dehydrogenase / fumarate reductase flavoprotein subunit
METLNMLRVGQMVIGAARMRKESRGPHLYFSSFNDSEPLPRDDESWRRYIIIAKEGKKMRFQAREPISTLR